MRIVLLGLAAALAAGALSPAPAPAAAQATAFTGRPLPIVHRGDPGRGRHDGFAGAWVGVPEGMRRFGRDGFNRDGFRDGHRGFHDGFGYGFGYGGYDSAYLDPNESWEADGRNDWWHERPWRSFPRWVHNNQDCQRLWWSGGGWRC